MFVGWEGVGLCSYLLIGFYYDRRVRRGGRARRRSSSTASATSASCSGCSGSSRLFGSARLRRRLRGAAADAPARFAPRYLTVVCLCLFVGAMGKCAQVPALRLAARRDGGPHARLRAHPRRDDGHRGRLHGRRDATSSSGSRPRRWRVVAVVGAVTAIFAATIAIAQNDIKKVLAYSTVSQLGYMFLACGVGAYAAGMFHVMTHAFFKACLFLGSGSVIHAMGGEQDMRKMGGLRRSCPSRTGRSWSRRSRSRGSRRSPASSRRTRSSAASVRGRTGYDPLRRRPLHGRADGLLHVPPRLADLRRQLPRHARAGASPPRVAAAR